MRQLLFFLLWIHLYLNSRFFLGTMPQGGARDQNLGHLKKSFFFFAFIFLLCNQSYLKNRHYSGLTFSPRFFFCFFLSFAESFVVEQQTLFEVDLIHICMI